MNIAVLSLVVLAVVVAIGFIKKLKLPTPIRCVEP